MTFFIGAPTTWDPSLPSSIPPCPCKVIWPYKEPPAPSPKAIDSVPPNLGCQNRFSGTTKHDIVRVRMNIMSRGPECHGYDSERPPCN